MVKKSSRPRGRPRRFDEAEALRGATHVFWAKGYDGATVDDLVAGTGVARPSLYATFGDKATLFMRCLEDYAARSGTLTLDALQEGDDVRAAIRGFMRFSVESATHEDSPLGCLMVCVAPLVEDEKVRAFLMRGTSMLIGAIEGRLREGIDAGELPPDFPCGLRARQSVDLLRGLVIRARMGTSRNELLADAEAGAALLLGLSPPSL